MQIAKKVLAVFLAALFVLPGLGALYMPACAQDGVEIIIVPDKTVAAPGETVTYTVSIGPVSYLKTGSIILQVPEGLTFVPFSESELNELNGKLANVFTNAGPVYYENSTRSVVFNSQGYSSSEPTELMQFRCTVADNASGELTVGIDGGHAFTFNKYYDLAFPTYDPSKSAVTVRVPEVSFYVPEAVYLKTGDKGTQWYLNSCGDNGVRPPAPKDTTGKLYFHCDGATDIRITSDGAVVNLITTGTDTIADNDFQIVSDKGGRVTYTATYTAGGMTRTAKAYTYIYMPYRVPTGCATEAESDEHNNGKYDYHGIVTALWGAQNSGIKENTSLKDGADVADESIYLGNKGLVTAANSRPRNSGMVKKGDGTFGAQNNDNKNLSITSPTAYFCVDTSRFTNMNQIPNMYVGLTQTDDQHTDYCTLKTYLADGHTSGQTMPVNISTIIPETQTETETVIRQEGACTIDYDVSDLQPAELKNFTVFTYGESYCDSDSGYYTKSYQHTHFQIVNTDKSALRELYLSEIGKNYVRQEGFYSSGWDNYKAYMRTAAECLGNPYVTIMEVQAAATTLQQAINGLEAIPPAVTRTAIERDGTDGYRVYAQVETNGGAPIDRVQFPTWTDKNGQDDIQKNWENNSAASGTFGAWSVDGQQYNYMYYVDVCDHNIEYAGYNTHVYAYNVAGASAHAEADKVNFDYTVRFEGCGATGGSVAAQTVIYGESVTLPSVEREGYMFLGWAETANADAPQYQSGKTFKPSEDTTLYAVWGVAAPSVARDSKAIELAANGKAGNILGAQQSSVWFGNYMQSGNKTDGWKVDPVKWRVLSNADGKLFLLADQNLDVVQYNEANTSVTWADCTLRKWLNGYENHPYDDTFIGSAFSEKELTAVADSKVENANNPEYNTNGGDDTTDKVFLLSIAEATNTAYGFTDNVKNTDTRISTNTQYVANGGHTGGGMYGVGGGADYWWLRSPGRYDDLAAFVSYVGYLFRNGNYVDRNYVAVRPAFKMNLNSVLFTSAAENGKQGDGLTAVGDYDGSDWKLTLLDNSRADFTASCTKDENGVRTITYSGAQTGENEMISAMIVDADGIVTYYGALENAKAGENTVTVNVNGKLQSGDKLYVFNEQTNGDKKTDYASVLVDVTEKALTKYDLWVGGVQFDEDNLEINANDIPSVTGSATYDPENNELTLDGFQYTGEGYRYLVDPGTQNEQYYAAGIYYTGTDELTVRLVQENAVTVTGDATNSYGFRSENLRTAVTFTGTGSLTARGADNAQSISYGITVSGSLCVEKQATVTGVGGDSSKSSYGVTTYVLHTKLEVYGTLTGNGGSASNISCGVYGAEITVGTDAVLTAAGSAGDSSRGIIADSVTVRSGTVEAASGEGERYSLAFKAKTGDNIAFDLSDDLTMRAGESKDENEIVTGDGWKNQKYVLIGEPATFSVTVTAGEGMTKTADSGDASQTVEKDSAMTAVVYTANTGYYFPTDYVVDSVNGVRVTRISFTQITVSGTPTADAAITLPAATAKGAPDMTVSAESVDVGEEAEVIVTLPADATGKVTFTIMEIREGGNVEAKKIENVPLEDAVAKASTAALPAGKYQVIADYSGDYKYTAATEQGDFVIRSRDGSITIALDKTKINVGESAVLSVVIPPDAGVIPGSGGNVTVKLNGTELQTITAENGKGNFTISSLHAGVYEVSAVFNGDGLYGAATSNLVQLVVVGTTELALEVWPGSEIEYGEPIIITATLSGDGDPVFAADDHVPVDDNDAALGGVTITVDGKTYYTVPANPGDPAITIDGNVASIQLPAPDAGLHYTVEANYRGDATHPAAKAEAGFTVRKSRTHIEVEYTESILAGETQTIKIILNSPLATGNVTVTLNGTQTNLELKNGSAFFETPPLPAGNYDLEVTYPANDNFEGAGKSVSFEVVSRDSGMTAALTDAAGTPLEDSTVAYGETAYVLATLPDDATGAVTFSLDGNTVEPTDDNPLLCALAGLSTGDHSVKVDFAGDDRYNKATVTVTFTVVCDHVWNEPEWNWENVANPSYSTTCSICEDAAEGNVPSTAGERVAATTETDAYTPYTATVILDGQEFIGKHNVVEPGTSLEFCKETFNAHKDALIDEADKKALEGDSDEAAALIENAEKAINDVEYDETKTYQDNIDALDDAVDFDQLDKDLTDQRAADAVEDKIDAIGEVEYTDESKQKIDDARDAYDALTDEQKDLVDNLDTLTDAEEKYEQLDNHAQFDDYKEAQKKAAGDKALPGDSDECTQLIEDAKKAINDAQYDESLTLQQNKDAVDAAANLAQLDADLAEHRAIHYAQFYADGKPVESVPYTIDTKSITEPAVPEKTGYTGTWPSYTLKAGGVRIDAVYETIPYEAQFFADGVLVDTVTYNVETTSIKDDEPAVPDKPGHTGAWQAYTLKVGGTRIDAVYEVIMQTVDFDANGGKGEMESVTTAWGSTITLPECTFTAPNGKEFDKWDAGDPGDEVEVKSDLTVKAIWKEKPLTLTADVDPTQTGERIKITVPYARRGGIAATLTASEEGVRYESSKPGVISVDENGVIRLEKLCLFCKTATITAYSADGQKVASCVVNVRHAWWQYIIWFFFGSFWF